MAKHSCSRQSIAALGVALSLWLGGCDESVADDLGEDELDAEHEFRKGGDDHACGFLPPPNPVFHDPPVDCTESQDLGYDAGTPFEITVVQIDGKPVEKDTANAFWVMRQAAAADGVDIHINSGFRTMAEQEYFYMCYQCGCCNNGNLAAQPGYSNHQSGHALDLNTSAAGVYGWLAANGGAFGFTETVPSEDWHWEWWGGGPGGGICDIASPPAGSVDSTGCDSISGWAQDPDAPEAHLNVQVVIDGAPGEPQAIQFDLVADVPRDDLCEPLGSCDHAFELEVPLGLRDGEPHTVRVFAIDSDGGENTELAVTSGDVLCSAPPLPDGVRRLLPSPATFETWQFDTLWDVAHVGAEELASLDEGPDLGDAPFLVTDATGTDTWLVDKGVRRPIVDPDVAAAWRFDLAAVVELEEDQLADIPEGTPLRDTPLLATGDGVQMWLIDDPQANAPDGSGDGSASGGGSADGGDDGDDDGSDGDESGSDDGALPADGGDGDGGGCACRVEGGRGFGGMVLLLGVGLMAVTRRRSFRSRSSRSCSGC
jgi:MYXO-CTERM domain-containing protein